MIAILLDIHCTKKCCPGCQLPAATSTLRFGQYLADPEARNCPKPRSYEAKKLEMSMFVPEMSSRPPECDTTATIQGPVCLQH